MYVRVRQRVRQKMQQSEAKGVTQTAASKNKTAQNEFTFECYTLTK